MQKLILLTILSCLNSMLFGQDSYTAPESGQLLIEACEGTVYDSGGPTGEYTDDNESIITIEATEGDYLTITFTEFDLEANFDFLTIYAGDTNNGELVGVYSGSNLPNDGTPIDIPSDRAIVIFSSDFIITGAGFAFDFACLTNDQPPVAAATFPSLSCTENIAFSDQSSGFPNTWTWDFGDGNSSTDQNPVHTYAAAGSYTVSLTACNNNGCDTFTALTPVNYEPDNEICTSGINIPPFNHIETQACAGILFDPGGPEGDYSEGNYGSILIAPITSSGISIYFTEFDLGNFGEHTDMLYILDPETHYILATFFGDELPNGGQPISFDVSSIAVYFSSDHANNFSGFTMFWESEGTSAPPVASFSSSNTTVPLNTPVTFTDESQNSPGSWLWNFGDGTTSELQNPTHVFTTPGTYEVNLEVANCNSSDTADPITITVLSAPELTYNPTAFDVTLEAGTTLTENISICNIGDGPMVVSLTSGNTENDFGYSFSFTTNQNGEDFSWAITDTDFNTIAESSQDYEANQTYTEQVSGLSENETYYLLLESPVNVQTLEQFMWLDPATGEVLFEAFIETGSNLWYLLPPPMAGQFTNWLSVETIEVTVEPNQCIDVPVTFDATDLFAGVYEGSININSNDPNQPSSTIPVTMTVTGIPQIAVTPQVLDFGALQVGASASLNFTISNNGTDELTLTGLTSAESAFAFSSAESLTIAPGNSQVINVTFTPAAVTDYAATLSLDNNAGDPVLVNLSGSGIPAPALTISPDAFEVELIAGEDTTLVTNIGNVGEADLDYSIQSSSEGIGFLFEFTTDFWGEEFYWTLTDSQEEIVLSSESDEYQSNTEYAEPLGGLMITETYTLNLFDTFGDGALPEFRVSDLNTGATIVEGAFTLPENPSQMTLDLGSPSGSLLAVNPASGTIGVDNSQAVNIGVETEGMATGTYNIDVIVATNDPLQPEATVDITLYVIAPVSTDFSTNNTFVCGLIPVEFTDLTSNTATAWTWDFGDGTSTEEQNPSHIYQEDGIYTVALISCNSLGCDTLTRENYITVETECYSENIPMGHDETIITVCEGNVYDSGGPNSNYLEGSFGRIFIAPPGATEVSITFSEFHYEEHADFLYIYDGPYGTGNLIGAYTGNDLEGVTLTATSGSLTLFEYTDHFNNKSGFVATFSCNNVPSAPIAGISYTGNNDPLCSNEPIVFSDVSTGEPDEWFWDFGDGVTSNLENPVHLYTESGTYQVQLTTCNSIGCDTKIISITIEVDPDCIIDSIPEELLDQRYITGCTGELYDSGGPDEAHLDGIYGSVTIISPSPNLGIVFTEFDMSEEGYITVHDGYDIFAPIIGVYTGNELPEGGVAIIASGNVLTIYENSGNNPNGSSGFSLNYFCENSFVDPSAGIRVSNGEMCDGIMTFRTPDDMPVDSWTWNFGDGILSTEAVPEHEFPHEGAFAVSLVACYDGDCNSYVTSIYSNKITPEISAPNLITVGTEVNFIGMTENVTHWNWDFGNGEVADHNAPSTVYDLPGEYDVHIHMVNMNVHETCDAEHTHSITIVEDGTVSTEEFTEEAIKVYPNPATDVLNVDLGTLSTDDVQLRIFSMDGQLIRQWPYQGTEISIGNLSAGTYFLEVTKDNFVPQRIPFVKIR
jgi:PKD repeat protein